MLVLTYNPQFQDGFGAQYQRILGIYAICKHFNIAYYHTNFTDIHYQGLNALMKNENNKEYVDKLNDRIHINSDITDIKDYPTTKRILIEKEELLDLKEKYISFYEHFFGADKLDSSVFNTYQAFTLI